MAAAGGTLDGTVTSKLLCPNLVTMLTKTIRAMCEVNVMYGQRLEINGSLHIHSDGRQVLSCLIDEHFDRPAADDPPPLPNNRVDCPPCPTPASVEPQRQAGSEGAFGVDHRDGRSTDGSGGGFVAHPKLEYGCAAESANNNNMEFASDDEGSDGSRSSVDGSTVQAAPPYSIMYTNAGGYSQRKPGVKLADFASFIQMDCSRERLIGENHVNDGPVVGSEECAQHEQTVKVPVGVKNEPPDTWQPRTTAPPLASAGEPALFSTGGALAACRGDGGGGGTRKKKFQCMLCGIFLSAKCYLKNHINAVHTKARVYPCEVCKKLFYSAGAVRIHKLRNHWHDAKKHRCRHCGELFLLPVELRKHLIKVHAVVPPGGVRHMPAPDEVPLRGHSEMDTTHHALPSLIADSHMDTGQAVFP